MEDERQRPVPDWPDLGTHQSQVRARIKRLQTTLRLLLVKLFTLSQKHWFEIDLVRALDASFPLFLNDEQSHNVYDVPHGGPRDDLARTFEVNLSQEGRDEDGLDRGYRRVDNVDREEPFPELVTLGYVCRRGIHLVLR